VKFVIHRTISDTGGEEAADDFDAYLEVVLESFFRIVSAIQ
jgi:hypothetical protein